MLCAHVFWVNKSEELQCLEFSEGYLEGVLFVSSILTSC